MSGTDFNFENGHTLPAFPDELTSLRNDVKLMAEKVNEIHAVMVAITEAFEAAQSNPMLRALMPKLNLNGKDTD